MRLTLSRYYHLQKTKIDPFDALYMFPIANHFLNVSISVLNNRKNDTLPM